jgi:hypothetical protein
VIRKGYIKPQNSFMALYPLYRGFLAVAEKHYFQIFVFDF